MKNILLYGIWGVYNYGCEAIVRGTVNSLRTMFPDATITYASFDVEDDKKRLKGCDIKIIERPFHNSLIKRIIRKLLSYVNIDYPVYIDSFDLVNDYDLIVSIGGDMYTISSTGYYPYSLMKFGDVAIQKGKKYILWGCSIGPFDDHPKILRKFQQHLGNVSLIVSREHETVEYLEKIGVSNNVFFAPDPAYNVATDNIKIDDNSTEISAIGINLSPLSTLYFTDNLEEAIKNQSKTISDIIKELNCKVILLPHVLSKDIKDDDYRYLLKIKNIVSKIHGNRIEIVENDPGFIGIKEHIKRCDVVVAARMHCAVNAVATHIPAIFLSYSKKSLGMANLIYKSTDFVMDLEEFNNSGAIIAKIREILKIDKPNFYSKVNELRRTSYLGEVKKHILTSTQRSAIND
ncbi:polysaccharide pyruvyl transferase family protein [Arenibacter sp. F20364]|uniref:polysaccharide pyruvyl transferase family protein n=1 Tax=Arenibacter sp. F20364 TaxID=2926415 RepID=UPI001FF3F64F|nr:polysaccharide pyruvyl transferase family protein [Arenibacter sp. F20364]MCK0191658.1 polysaccharide pyruvyl transferase family protein [Arenibacter sp. F20364]